MFKKLLNLFRSHDKNSLEALQQRVEQGDAEAMYQLGRIYDIGKVVEADYDKAITLYHRANALGYPLAANNIGAFYDNHMGEPEKAVEWFEQGIRQGDKRSVSNLGRFYLLGIGVEQNMSKGLEMLETNAAQDGLAAILLAQAYDGVLVGDFPIDYPKALEYYLLAEKNTQDLDNHLLSTLYTNLGALYNAHDDIPTNYPEAQKYLTKAAEMGLPHAMLNLGHLHAFHGDHKQAFKWYLKAAENDLVDAYYYVGVAYKEGKGITQDSQKAVKWLEAVEYEMHGAAWELAEIYRDGIGNVPQNLEKAQAYYQLAQDSGENQDRSLLQIQSRIAVHDNFDGLLERAEQGDLAAQKDLAMAYMRGYEIEENVEEAFKWYKAAAEQGDADAQNSLYNRYAIGDGVVQNSEEAMKWLHRSADQGYGLAYYNLGWNMPQVI